MNIYNDDDPFVFGTKRDDIIIGGGQTAEYYGGKGNDVINPGIGVHPGEIVMVFGGTNAHDTRDPSRFHIDTPRAFSGNDRIAVGLDIWGDGEDGFDFYESHGPSFFGARMPRVWMDWKNDGLAVDNSNHSRDGTGIHRDGTGFENGFELVNIHFARTFVSKAGYHHAEVNGFTIHSLSNSPAVREQFTDILFYDKGDDPDHHRLFVQYDPEVETAREAVADFAHEHSVAGPDQFIF